MNTHQLDHAIRRTGFGLLVNEVCRALFVVVTVLLFAGVAALALDAVWALPPAGLITVDLLLAGLAAGSLVYIVVQWWRHRFNKRRLARLIEQRLGVTDNRLINAIDLSEEATSDGSPRGATSSELRDESVARGDMTAAKLNPEQAIDRGPLGRALAAALVWVLLIVGFYFVAPGVFNAVVPRYLHPLDDLPPYTLLSFQVKVNPEPVILGRSTVITAGVTGPNQPTRANLVFVDGDERQRVPMLRRDDGNFVLHVKQPKASRQFYIETEGGRSRRHELNVLPVPMFERVRVTYKSPPYAPRPRIMRDLGPEGIRYLRGSTIKLDIESSMPLRHVEVIQAGEGAPQDKTAPRPIASQLRPTSDDPTKATLEFPLLTSGRFKLRLVGANGLPGPETITGPLTAVHDTPPRVRIDDPGMEVIAVENWQVPVLITADDDVGITKLELHRGVNGWGPTTVPLTIDPDSRERARARYVFDLAKLGARAGDVITYHATAYDNFPGLRQFTPPGPQTADTERYTIRVITEEEYLAYARGEKQMEDLVDELDDLQKQLGELESQRQDMLDALDALEKKLADQGGEMTDEDREQLKQIEDKLAEYAKRSKDLGDEAQERSNQPALYEFEQEYLDMLSQLADSMGDQAQRSQDLLDRHRDAQQNDPDNADRRAREFMKDLADQLGGDQKNQQPFDQQQQLTEEDFRKIQAADEMLSLAQRISQIAKQQRDLADRLGQYRAKPQLSDSEQQRADRMAREQEDLKRELEEALEQLERAADLATDDLPKMCASARQLAATIRDLAVTDDQGEASKLAQAGQGSGAHRSADRAAEKLESLIGQCQSMQGEAGGELDQALSLSRGDMGKALQQLAQARQLPGMPSQAGQPSSGTMGGAMGSATRAALMGPNTPEGDSKRSRMGRRDGRGRGGPGAGSGQGAAAELLDPRNPHDRAAAAAALLDVPLKWRDKAADYFRRLASDSR